MTEKQAVAALYLHYCSFESYIQERERVLMEAAGDVLLDIVLDCETMGPREFRAKYGQREPSRGHIHEWLKAQKGRKEGQDAQDRDNDKG
jgi:hypothetical protein